MPRILLIGSGSIRNLCQEALVSSGYSTFTFDSLDKAFPVLDDKVDLIIADKKLSSDPRFKEFLRISKSFPKLILSDTHSFRGFTPWMKGSVMYPLFNPNAHELDYFVKRILKENKK